MLTSLAKKLASAALVRALLVVSLSAVVLAATQPGCSEIVSPTASAGEGQTVAVGTLVQLDGSGSSDPGGMPLTFAWRFVELPAGSEAVLGGSSTVKPFFTADRTGSYRVALIVSNGVRTSEQAEVVIEAGECGSNVPVVDAISATPDMPAVGQPVSLAATVSHADTDCGLERAIAHEWWLSKLPAGSSAAIFPADAETPSFVPDVAGSYEVSLRASDDAGHQSVVATLEVVVSGCGVTPPVAGNLAASPAAPAIGQAVQLSAEVSDADEQAPCSVPQTFEHAWKLAAAPAGSVAQLNLPGAENPSFTVDLPGEYVVELVVSDGSGLKSEVQSLAITASACGGNAPTVTAVTVTPTPSNVKPAVGEPLSLAATVEDADTLEPCNLSETFSHHWELVAAPAGSSAVLLQPGAESPSLVPDVPGDYTVRVVVTDAHAKSSAPFDTEVTVTACGSNAPVAMVEQLTPVIAAPSGSLVAADVAPGTVVQISAAGSTDADNADPGCNLGQTLGYHWQLTQLPAGSSAALNSDDALNPSFVADVVGTYVVALTVTDSLGQASDTPALFTITANAGVDVNLANGFTISTVAHLGLLDAPRGIVEIGNDIFVVSGDDQVLKVAGTQAVSLLAAGSALDQAVGITSDGNQLIVATGAGRVVKVSLDGSLSICRDVPTNGFRGIHHYAGTGGARLLVADRAFDRIEILDPMTCVLLNSNNLGGGWSSPWGVDAATINGVDHLVGGDAGGSRIQANSNGAYGPNDGGTDILVSSGVVASPRDVVFTPCPTPKILVANHDGDSLVLFANQASAAPLSVATNLDSPSGLEFEDAQNLLVTSEGGDAVFRISGNFCAL